MRAAFLVLIVGVLAASAAQAGVSGRDAAGRWLTGHGEGVIEIYRCGTGLCGRIVGITLDHLGDPMPKDVWGRPQCDETIVVAQRRSQDGVWHGTILNPNNGRRYHAEFHVADDGTLKLRGYVGVPLFGQTQTWTRFDGPIGAHCLMARRKPPQG